MSDYLFNLVVIAAYGFSILGALAAYWLAWDRSGWLVVLVLLVANLVAMATSGVGVRS